MSVDEAIQQAVRLLQAGDKAQAREILKTVLISSRDNCQAWALMANVAENRQEAVFCLKQVLRLRPGDAWATEKLEDLAPLPAPLQEPAASETPGAMSSVESSVPSFVLTPPLAPARTLPTLERAPTAAQPESLPVTPQTQTDVMQIQEGPQWMIEAVQAGRVLLRPGLAAAPPKQEELPRSAVRFLLATIGIFVVAVIGVVIFVVYREQFATNPEDEKLALQAAQEWAIAAYTLDFAKKESLTCSRYDAPEIDFLSDLLMKQMGVDPNAVGTRLKIDPPRNLKYEILDLRGGTARVKVTGLMSNLPRGALTGLSEDMYRRIYEPVYIMKREDGMWKWCGQE